MVAHGINFHHFYDSLHVKGQGAISADELDAMIHYVGRERILPAREWMDRALSDRLRDRDICLTFDDNLLCQYEIALPVLEQYGLTGFWFVYTSVLDGGTENLELYRWFRSARFDHIDAFYDQFMTTLVDCVELSAFEQGMIRDFNPATYLVGFDFHSDSDRLFRFVRDKVLGTVRYEQVMDEMIVRDGVKLDAIKKQLWMDEKALHHLHASGHVVGLHSHTHPTRLEDLDLAGQKSQYRNNASRLEQITGERPVAMSHPCNSYNDTTLGILTEMDVLLGFRSNMVQQPAASRFEFPRDDHTNIINRMRR